MSVSPEFRTLLEEGCHQGCDYDEAEGGLLNHCDRCCRKIAEFAVQMLQDKDGDRYRWLRAHMAYYRVSDAHATIWQHITTSNAITLDDVVDEHMHD